ncbi:MAG: DNA repair protein RadC [Opitutaceae bacterium]|nr:DNA repair protein RadC [Opitutaceae bacterium]
MKQGLLNLGDSFDGAFAIAGGEKPQRRMEDYGSGALSDTELVAMLLQDGGVPAEAAVGTASRLLAEAGSIRGLARWEAQDYRRLRGIGPRKAGQLAAVTEIARRMMAAGEARPVLNRPEQIAEYLKPYAAGLTVEKFWVLCLDRKNRLLKRVEITSGTATATLAHPREVFRAAIRESAAAVACAHNHPSGDPAPSAADLQATKQLREASRAVDIVLVDHVVVGAREHDPLGQGFYSFRAAGLI